MVSTESLVVVKTVQLTPCFTSHKRGEGKGEGDGVSISDRSRALYALRQSISAVFESINVALLFASLHSFRAVSYLANEDDHVALP